MYNPLPSTGKFIELAVVTTLAFETGHRDRAC